MVTEIKPRLTTNTIFTTIVVSLLTRKYWFSWLWLCHFTSATKICGTIQFFSLECAFQFFESVSQIQLFRHCCFWVIDNDTTYGFLSVALVSSIYYTVTTATLP